MNISPELVKNNSQNTKPEAATEDNSKNKQIDNRKMLENKNTSQNN